ncbi:hypothetical protein [Afipia carboxidovorans]|uniref:hypothetical protein n=1 Tax=Afipia carboxidovorans TaxID=40137 RepID=UPI0030D022D4
MDDLKARGGKYFSDYADRFTGSHSKGQTDSIIAEIEQETADRKLIDANGWSGVAAGLVAGTIDPTMFLPVGTGVKAARFGMAVLDAGKSVGKSALMQSAAQEALLYGTQEMRTPTESLLNIGSATLLGGMLGSGAYALLAREGLVPKVAASLDEARNRLSRHNGFQEGDVAPESSTTNPANSNEPPEAVSRSIGAAASDTRDLSPVPYGLDSVPGVRDVMPKIWPNLNVLTNGTTAARRAVAELSEVPIALKENVEGGTTTFNGGPAIDREIKMIREGLHVRADDEMMRLWGDHLSDGGNKNPSFWQRQTGAGVDGKMSFDEFDAAVYDALSTGDVHPVPQVQAAAQWIRANGLEPIKNRALSAIDGFAETATREGETYAPRLWNTERISGRWNEYVDTWTQHLEGEQTRKAQIQSDIEQHVGKMNAVEDQVAKLEAMRERIEARQIELGGRLDEKAMEIRSAEKRGDILTDRQSSIAEEIRETRQFIAELRQEVRDPALRDRIDSLEREAAALERADRPVTDADLARLDDEELKTILSGSTRKAAKMLVGEMKVPKTPSFVSWIIRQGGLRADAENVGDVLASIDRQSWHGRRIVNNKGGRTVEDIADKIGEDFPNARGEMDANRGRPTSAQVLRWIDDAAHGREPDWFVQAHPNAANIEAAHQAAMLDELFSRAGVEVKTTKDVAAVLRGERRAGVTLEDLDRIAADMEASGEAIPLSLRRADIEEQLVAGRDMLAGMRQQIADAIKARDAKANRLKVAQARGDEAAMRENEAYGRLGVLQQRMDRAEARRALLDDALAVADQSIADIRKQIEAKLEAWGGKSAREAVAAIEARTDAESLRTATRNIRAGAGIPLREAGRLKSADRAVDRAVKRILASDRTLTRQELRARAEEIASRQIGTPDGRLPYDVESASESGFGGSTELRGHAARRQIDLPYDIAKPWLDRSATRALKSYTHSVLPDAIIAERFGGDPAMTSVMKEIETEYAARRAAAKSETEQNRLKKQMDSDIRIVAGMRDRIRGTFAFDPQMRGLARASQAALKINNIVSSHMMAVSSLPDMAGVVFRNGMESAFKDAWLPFFRAMTDKEAWTAWKAQGSEFKAFGIGIETQSASRQHALSEINESYRPASKFERTITWLSDKAFIANLLAPLTDLQKRMAANAVSHNILRAAKAVAEGKATKKQVQMLGEGNITAAQAARIWEQFSNNGGADVKGVLLPNTDAWTDAEALRVFRGAVARDVDIAVVQPGQEKPFFMSRPGLNVLGQYKAFTISATQRILIANLQRRDASSLAGLVMAVGMGMLSYKINSLAAGTKTSDRPQDWIKEGLSRGGILGVLEDANSLAAKSSGGKVDLHRLYGADKPLSRFASRDAASMLLGPTFGKVQSLTQVTSAASRAAGNKISGNPSEWTESDTHALRMMALGSNFPYLPLLFNQVEKGVNGAFGIPMKSN